MQKKVDREPFCSLFGVSKGETYLLALKIVSKGRSKILALG
jgi:hypothetical protein